MKTRITYLLFGTLMLTILTGCSSSGYSGSSTYYHHNVWEYDNYYRSGVNHYYNRPAVQADVRARTATRSGGAVRTGGARGGGGRR